MKIVLFVNDSYFSYLLAKPVIERFHTEIKVVVFSSRIKRSILKIKDVFKKTYCHYFFYRSLIEVITRFNFFLRCKSVLSLVKQYDLKMFTVANINNSNALEEILPSDIGLAFNYDQIFKDKFLKSFRKGIINVHASRLPKDKGISPVLWAFARGDNSVWSTIYKMDKGIDTGVIFKQFEVPVKNGDTAFSLYERVCTKSGYEFANLVESMKAGIEEPISQSRNEEGNYWGWPDKTHKRMMEKSGRKLFNFREIFRLLMKPIY